MDWRFLLPTPSSRKNFSAPFEHSLVLPHMYEIRRLPCSWDPTGLQSEELFGKQKYRQNPRPSRITFGCTMFLELKQERYPVKSHIDLFCAWARRSGHLLPRCRRRSWTKICTPTFRGWILDTSPFQLRFVHRLDHPSQCVNPQPLSAQIWTEGS